jgi:hypothetical protein
LVDKLGDNLLKIRTSSEDALLSISQHPSFGGASECLNVLARPAPTATSKDAKKAMLSNKHVVGKYGVMLKMLQSGDIGEE